MSEKLNRKAILLAKLTEEELGDLANFDCKDEGMNKFLKKEAYSEQQLGMNNTTLMYYEGTLAGFYSICADSLKLAEEEQSEDLVYATVPAIKIARIARDVKFKNLEIGKFLIDHAKYKALEIDNEHCGVRMITLDAYLNRVEYYESQKFKKNEHRMYNGKNRTTVSMRYDIYSEAFQDLR
ncbi:hypothetical protein [Phosphitispora fastidiosa]|uniref:hypothetical protein n=1 Tax=Phosphitispora fastidiosa TaxID=2837202 RepID=UPI001E3FC8F4|nr:hypothetical protein [Phosphitispora fastidiosa]MBU7005259.1 hypothetical protein [Phosphitispora fastidiosa]